MRLALLFCAALLLAFRVRRERPLKTFCSKRFNLQKLFELGKCFFSRFRVCDDVLWPIGKHEPSRCLAMWLGLI